MQCRHPLPGEQSKKVGELMECYNCGTEVFVPLMVFVEETVYSFCCEQCLCSTDVLEEHLDNLIKVQSSKLPEPH